MRRDGRLLLVQLFQVPVLQLRHERNLVSRIGARRETVVVSSQPRVEEIIVRFARRLSLLVQTFDFVAVTLEAVALAVPLFQGDELVEGSRGLRLAGLELGEHEVGFGQKPLLASSRDLVQVATLDDGADGVGALGVRNLFGIREVFELRIDGLVSVVINHVNLVRGVVHLDVHPVFFHLADGVQKVRRLDVIKFGRGFSVGRPVSVRGVGGGVVSRRHASVELVTLGVVVVGLDLIFPSGPHVDGRDVEGVRRRRQRRRW